MNLSKKLLLALAAVAVVAAGSVAFAAVPGPDGTINACCDRQSGQLRITDPTTAVPKACGPKESSIAWNQKGVSRAFHKTDATKEITATTLSYPSAVVSERTLGPGTYMVTADLELTKHTLASVPLEVVTGALNVSFTGPGQSGGRFDYSSATVAADGTGDLIAGSISMSERLTVPAGGTGTAAVLCAAPHPVYADNVDLWALELDSIEN